MADEINKAVVNAAELGSQPITNDLGSKSSFNSNKVQYSPCSSKKAPQRIAKSPPSRKISPNHGKNQHYNGHPMMAGLNYPQNYGRAGSNLGQATSPSMKSTAAARPGLRKD